MLCDQTTAVITACLFRGLDAQFNTVPVPSHPGIRATNSKLWIATTAFSGGNAAASLQGPQLASPGLWLDRTDTLLAARVSSLQAGGEYGIWHDGSVRSRQQGELVVR